MLQYRGLRLIPQPPQPLCYSGKPRVRLLLCSQLLRILYTDCLVTQSAKACTLTLHGVIERPIGSHNEYSESLRAVQMWAVSRLTPEKGLSGFGYGGVFFGFLPLVRSVFQGGYGEEHSEQHDYTENCCSFVGQVGD